MRLNVAARHAAFCISLVALACSIHFSYAAVINDVWEVKWLFEAPDGYYRGVIAINQQFPGPTIRARVGDTINITFTVDEPGTYWYHAHTPMQYLDGLSGALIVYDIDEEPTRDEAIILQEWYHEPGLTLAVAGWWSATQKFRQIAAVATTLNGRGLSNCSEMYPVPPASMRCSTDVPELYSIAINPGEKLTLRIIGGTSETAIRFSIEEHDLQVVRFQRHLIEPVVVKSVDLHAGYRYDVVIQPKPGVQAGAKYKIYAQILRGSASKCALDPDKCLGLVGYGFLVYNGSTTTTTAAATQGSEASDIVLDLTPESLKYIVPKTDKVVIPSYTTQWDVDFQMGTHLDPERPHEGPIPSFTFNGHQFHIPSRPPLMEVYQDGRFTWPNSSLIWTTPLDSIFDVYFKNHDHFDHPVHMHGYSFYVLSIGETPDGVFPPADKLTLNTQNPVRGDTIVVPGFGWVYFRIIADNPGLWTFHCHIDSHNSPNTHHGMILVFGVGLEHLEKKAPLPKQFPMIVGNVYTGLNVDQLPPNREDSNPDAFNQLMVVVLVGAGFMITSFVMFGILYVRQRRAATLYGELGSPAELGRSTVY